jgi:hypothetical protein
MLTSIQENGEAVFQFVDVGKLSTPDLETAPTPAVWVFQGPEEYVEKATLGFDTWNWSILIEVWARDAEMEHLLGLIHAEMGKNNADGGLICSTTMGVVDVKRKSCELTLVDPTKSLEMMSIVYSVTYRNPYGVP